MKFIPIIMFFVGAGIATAVILFGIGSIAPSDELNDASEQLEKSPSVDEIGDATVAEDENTEKKDLSQSVLIPKEYRLNVPFTPQAPHGIWDLPYKEACEEASMLMVGRYLNDRIITDADDADRAILQLTAYVEKQGYPVDITAEETAKLLHDFYEVETDVIYDFTWDQVKEAISSGYPVIVPAAGRQLGNPNFTPPGPLYHMLVIIGYTETDVITNDPGTKNGEGYAYDYETFYNAVHDWNGGNVDSGRTVMIIARPKE